MGHEAARRRYLDETAHIPAWFSPQSTPKVTPFTRNHLFVLKEGVCCRIFKFLDQFGRFVDGVRDDDAYLSLTSLPCLALSLQVWPANCTIHHSFYWSYSWVGVKTRPVWVCFSSWARCDFINSSFSMQFVPLTVSWFFFAGEALLFGVQSVLFELTNH